MGLAALRAGSAGAGFGLESHDGEMIERDNKSAPRSLDLIIVANAHSKMGAASNVNFARGIRGQKN
jgi:hypothetical protein